MEKDRYIQGQSEARQFLRQSLEQQGSLNGQLFQHGATTLREVRLLEATPESLIFDLAKQESVLSLSNNRIHVTLTLHHHHVHLISRIVKARGSTLVADTPMSLWLYDKRNSVRRQFKPGQAHVIIKLPHKPSSPLKWQILDISDTGMAFTAPIDECQLLQGTPLPELRIESPDGNSAINQGTVMHVTVLGDSERVKVGVKFDRPTVTLPSTSTALDARKNSRWSWFRLGHIFRWLRTTPQENDPQVGPEVHTRFETLNGKRGNQLRLIHQNQTTSPEFKSGNATVIIAPGIGRSVESYWSLSLTLIDAFASQARPLSVIRYEATNQPSLASCNTFTLSKQSDCLRDVIDHVHRSLPPSAGPVVLVTHDIQSLSARRVLAEDLGRKVDLWVALNSLHSTDEQLNRSTGGIDLVGRQEKYGSLGPVDLSGIIVNGDVLIDDAKRRGYLGAEKARQDMARIPIPILWFRGESDPSLDLNTTRDLMLSTGAAHGRDLVLLPGAAVSPSSPQALAQHRELAGRLWQALHRSPRPVVSPSTIRLKRHRRYELAKTLRPVDHAARHTWRRLTSTAEGTLNICYLLGLTPEFTQVNKRLSNECRKHKGAGLHFGPSLDPSQYSTRGGSIYGHLDPRTHRLELSPMATIRRFINSKSPGYSTLEGMQGLPQHAVHEWRNRPEDWRLWQLLRGRELTPEDLSHLDKTLTGAAKEAALDINRLVRHAAENDGQLPEDAEHMQRFTWDTNLPSTLGIPPENYGQIIVSLLPAHEDILGLLMAFHQALLPGGLLQTVALSPFADLDTLEVRLLKKISHDPDLTLPENWNRPEVLEEARQGMQGLRRMALLAEQMVYPQITRESLTELMAQAAFRDVSVTVVGTSASPIGFLVKGFKR